MSDYLEWKSSLSLESVFAGSDSCAYPQYWRNGILYLSSLQEQQGRTVVMYWDSSDSFESAKILIPAPFSCRTKFSEYGGKPYWQYADALYFANHLDQCIYKVDLSNIGCAEPQRITPLPSSERILMFADLVQLDSRYLFATVEEELINDGTDSDRENRSYLGLIDLTSPDAEILILNEGADFYSNLCVDRLNQRVAWVQWNHPNMPWDETQLWIADLQRIDNRVGLVAAKKVNFESSASICQLFFANNGTLFFSADQCGYSDQDWQNFWNIYALTFQPRGIDSSQICEHSIHEVTREKAEFGYPHWQYGDARIAQLNDNQLISFATRADGDVLIKIDQDTLAYEIISDEKLDKQVNYQNLYADGKGRAAAMLLASNTSPAIAEFDGAGNCFNYIETPSAQLSASDISLARHIKYPTRDGGHAYAYFYPPSNSNYSPASQSTPPLIVMVHGGPTAKAYGFFDLQKQFWTQRGFAILDINHRGSSGYGRAFRDALYAGWGRIDTSDIADGVGYLVAQSMVDPKRVCIRGKSAGGYAVLCALTQYPEVFTAGACYYGIGNLVTLAETTHKFEKHYADRMIGETYHSNTSKLPDSAFQKRSPINAISQLQCAMIIFQGLEDKVVPPVVAHEIVDVLTELGLEHSYVEYADEGHGFKQATNNIDAWSKELSFYRNILKK